jgi:hypothetical protein
MNPYEATGTRFTAEEFELVQMGLTGIASAAQEHGQKDVHARSMDLIQRLQQYVVAGQGVPQSLMEDFGLRLQKAMQAQDSKAIVRLLRGWMATTIRLDPDPAKAIAKHLTEMMLMQNSGIGFLALVEQKCTGLVAHYEEVGWPDGDDILNFLRDWVAYGRKNLEAGKEPWPE